jgi:hypothetical protein
MRPKRFRRLVDRAEGSITGGMFDDPAQDLLRPQLPCRNPQSRLYHESSLPLSQTRCCLVVHTN